MDGKWIGLGLLAFCVVFGGGLYYAQTQAYYETVRDVTEVSTSVGTIPVAGYEGIDAPSSPLKLRACFEVEPELLAGLPAAPAAKPLVPPDWFTCFDAGGLTADLSSGAAVAHEVADETPEGSGYRIARYIAVYPDGRAFMWRQIFD